MKLFYFRGYYPNFGDELNCWLWPKLIPELLDEDASVRFLGIGSILYDTLDPDALKVVFGAGFGGYTKPPHLDGRWFVYFVRGPRTARALGLDPKLGLGDAGTLIRAAMPPPVAKRYRISFMPHYEGLAYGTWPEAAAQAGLHLIDPRWPVETVIDHILASESLVCEAMHGAIVADALRIPWIAAQPIMRSNRAKWHDWADTLGLTLHMVELRPSSWLERARQGVEGNRKRLRWISHRGLKLGSGLNSFWTRDAARMLAAAARCEPQLSSDGAIHRVTGAMLDQLEVLRAGRHFAMSRVAALTSSVA
jgi:succinoglycan biosynthesis protein ExoV